jgi:hypothetical protein
MCCDGCDAMTGPFILSVEVGECVHFFNLLGEPINGYFSFKINIFLA